MFLPSIRRKRAPRSGEQSKEAKKYVTPLRPQSPAHFAIRKHSINQAQAMTISMCISPYVELNSVQTKGSTLADAHFGTFEVGNNLFVEAQITPPDNRIKQIANERGSREGEMSHGDGERVQRKNGSRKGQITQCKGETARARGTVVWAWGNRFLDKLGMTNHGENDPAEWGNQSGRGFV